MTITCLSIGGLGSSVSASPGIPAFHLIKTLDETDSEIVHLSCDVGTIQVRGLNLVNTQISHVNYLASLPIRFSNTCILLSSLYLVWKKVIEVIQVKLLNGVWSPLNFKHIGRVHFATNRSAKVFCELSAVNGGRHKDYLAKIQVVVSDSASCAQGS